MLPWDDSNQLRTLQQPRTAPVALPDDHTSGCTDAILRAAQRRSSAHALSNLKLSSRAQPPQTNENQQPSPDGLQLPMQPTLQKMHGGLRLQSCNAVAQSRVDQAPQKAPAVAPSDLPSTGKPSAVSTAARRPLRALDGNLPQPAAITIQGRQQQPQAAASALKPLHHASSHRPQRLAGIAAPASSPRGAPALAPAAGFEGRLQQLLQDLEAGLQDSPAQQVAVAGRPAALLPLSTVLPPELGTASKPAHLFTQPGSSNPDSAPTPQRPLHLLECYDADTDGDDGDDSGPVVRGKVFVQRPGAALHSFGSCGTAVPMARAACLQEMQSQHILTQLMRRQQQQAAAQPAAQQASASHAAFAPAAFPAATSRGRAGGPASAAAACSSRASASTSSRGLAGWQAAPAGVSSTSSSNPGSNPGTVLQPLQDGRAFWPAAAVGWQKQEATAAEPPSHHPASACSTAAGGRGRPAGAASHAAYAIHTAAPAADRAAQVQRQLLMPGQQQQGTRVASSILDSVGAQQRGINSFSGPIDRPSRSRIQAGAGGATALGGTSAAAASAAAAAALALAASKAASGRQRGSRVYRYPPDDDDSAATSSVSGQSAAATSTGSVSSAAVNAAEAAWLHQQQQQQRWQQQHHRQPQPAAIAGTVTAGQSASSCHSGSSAGNAVPGMPSVFCQPTCSQQQALLLEGAAGAALRRPTPAVSSTLGCTEVHHAMLAALQRQRLLQQGAGAVLSANGGPAADNLLQAAQLLRLQQQASRAAGLLQLQLQGGLRHPAAGPSSSCGTQGSALGATTTQQDLEQHQQRYLQQLRLRQQGPRPHTAAVCQPGGPTGERGRARAPMPAAADEGLQRLQGEVRQMLSEMCGGLQQRQPQLGPSAPPSALMSGGAQRTHVPISRFPGSGPGRVLESLASGAADGDAAFTAAGVASRPVEGRPLPAASLADVAAAAAEAVAEARARRFGGIAGMATGRLAAERSGLHNSNRCESPAAAGVGCTAGRTPDSISSSVSAASAAGGGSGRSRNDEAESQLVCPLGSRSPFVGLAADDEDYVELLLAQPCARGGTEPCWWSMRFIAGMREPAAIGRTPARKRLEWRRRKGRKAGRQQQQPSLAG